MSVLTLLYIFGFYLALYFSITGKRSSNERLCLCLEGIRTSPGAGKNNATLGACLRVVVLGLRVIMRIMRLKCSTIRLKTGLKKQVAFGNGLLSAAEPRFWLRILPQECRWIAAVAAVLQHTLRRAGWEHGTDTV